MNYAIFRGWLDGSVIDEDQWSIVMAEDDDFNYAHLGVWRTSDTPQFLHSHRISYYIL